MPLYEFEGKRPRIDATAFVHPDAVLIGGVTIGAGCYIAAGAVLRADWGFIEVGEGSNIQDTCVVHSFPDETTIFGPAAHIAHGAIVHGAKLARHVVVGMNAVVLDYADLGEDSVVGSGAVVPARFQLPARSLAVGIPAKVVRELRPPELEQWMSATRVYQELAQRCLKSFSRIDP